LRFETSSKRPGSAAPQASQPSYTGRFVLLPKNLVTERAEARIVSRPTRTGRAPLEGDYLKPRLSRGFFMTGPKHAQRGAPNDNDPPATHDRSASIRATEARQREKGGGYVARRCRYHAACGDWLYRARFCSSVRALVGHACFAGGRAVPVSPIAARAVLRERPWFGAGR
jgi:hypothetical protein